MMFSITDTSNTDTSNQLLAESSNKAMMDSLALLKAELEHLYETREGEFSQGEILEDLAKISDIVERIKIANTLLEKSNILLLEYQPFSQSYINKYRDFLQDKVIETIKRTENYRVSLGYLGQTIANMASAFNEKNSTDKARKLLDEMIQLSVIVEQYIIYLPQDQLERIKYMVLELLTYPSLQPNQENISESAVNYLFGLRNTIRGILWQLDHYKEEKKSTVGNLFEWLKTAPTWSGDDFEECLDYVNQMRK